MADAGDSNHCCSQSRLTSTKDFIVASSPIERRLRVALCRPAPAALGRVDLSAATCGYPEIGAPNSSGMVRPQPVIQQHPPISSHATRAYFGFSPTSRATLVKLSICSRSILSYSSGVVGARIKPEGAYGATGSSTDTPAAHPCPRRCIATVESNRCESGKNARTSVLMTVVA